MTHALRHTIWNRRSARRAFTFVELIVAVALSVVLLRGMYSVFSAATNLTRLSDEKMNAVLEAAAAFDAIVADIARSPSATPSYYLSVTTGADPSVTFQANRADGGISQFVHVKYYLNNRNLVREVWNNDRSALATLTADGEDGSAQVIGRNISSWSVSYFNNAADSITASNAWQTGTLTGTDRTRAVKFEIGVQGRKPEATIADDKPFGLQITQIVPITCN